MKWKWKIKEVKITFRGGPWRNAAAGRAAAAAALRSQVAQEGEEVLPLGAAGQSVQWAVASEITSFIAAADGQSGRASGAFFPHAAAPSAGDADDATAAAAVRFTRSLFRSNEITIKTTSITVPFPARLEFSNQTRVKFPVSWITRWLPERERHRGRAHRYGREFRMNAEWKPLPGRSHYTESWSEPSREPPTWKWTVFQQPKTRHILDAADIQLQLLLLLLLLP